MKKLTLKAVEAMSDDEVFALSIPHPEVSGQRAFAFSLNDFGGDRAEMAACMAALVARMRKM